MGTKQLNVWIPEELRDYIARRAEEEKQHMNAIMVEMIRNDMIKRNEHLIEQMSLLAMQEMIRATVHAELRKAHIQLRHDLREDWQWETETFFERLRSYWDSLAGLLTTAVRNSSISRRLIYACLSKAHGTPFAKAVYDDAREKVAQELVLK